MRVRLPTATSATSTEPRQPEGLASSRIWRRRESGFGIATGIADLAAREGIAEDLTLTVEQGVVGGTPVTGVDFEVRRQLRCPVEQSAQFDFYDGGGLDLAFLSFAEVDNWGNVNVSRFAGRPNGAGGIIHIAQNAKAVCFLGTLTAGGLVVEIEDGQVADPQGGRTSSVRFGLEQ